MQHPKKDKIFRNIMQWDYCNANVVIKISMIINKGIFKILLFISWKLQPLHLNSQQQNGMNSHSQQHYISVPVFSFQPWRRQTSCHWQYNLTQEGPFILNFVPFSHQKFSKLLKRWMSFHQHFIQSIVSALKFASGCFFLFYDLVVYIPFFNFQFSIFAWFLLQYILSPSSSPKTKELEELPSLLW